MLMFNIVLDIPKQDYKHTRQPEDIRNPKRNPGKLIHECTLGQDQ